jgi:electron transfer flavoprotein alpha subunit
MSAQDILVVGETHLGALSDTALELLGAARQLADADGGRVVVLLLGREGASHAAALQAADHILVIDDPQLDAYCPEPYLTALEHVIQSEGPRAVLLGSTSIGLDIGPALAGRLGAAVVSGCRQIARENGSLKVTASICAGKMLAEVEVSKSPAILLILPGSFRPSSENRQPQVETRASPVSLRSGAITFERMILPQAGDVDITKEHVLVGVGRGIQRRDNLELAEELAAALGGQVCASRPIIDQGWLPATRQVGKSGMIVKPRVYFALGVSGAPEHQEGMKGSELIIAVNTDRKAPIFEIAHYGVQMDLLDVVPALIEALKTKRAQQ